MSLLVGRINGLTEDLSTVVSKLADEVSPKTVHRLRTTIRRIESLVSYSHPEIGKKLERSLEKLTDLRKRAGKVRDLDVQQELLGALGNGSTAKDRNTISDMLKKKRVRQAKRLSSAVKKLMDSKFSARMRRIAEKVSAGPGDSIRLLAPLDEARMQLAHMSAEYASVQKLKPNRLHEARIQLKMVRYLAELAEESPERKLLIDELKAVQDAVGEWHDWEALCATAEKRFTDRVNCALLREVRALFAAQQSAANAAILKLLAQYSPVPLKKQPTAAEPVRTFARPA